MLKETRQKFNGFTTQVASLNGVTNVAEKFNVTPSVQQKMESRVQQSAEFLQKINFEYPIDQSGEKIGVGVGSTIAGRTNTEKSDRNPSDPTALSSQKYNCRQTNYDTTLRYSTLDAWAHRPEFQPFVRDAILKRKALDRILIGFNGIMIAEDTNREKYPLLQDVNKGWLQKYREDAPERVMTKGKTGTGKIKIGVFTPNPDATDEENEKNQTDYNNLDALVVDAKENLIDEVFSESADLVVLCNRNTLSDKYFPIVNEANSNMEKVAGKMLMSTKLLGGLPAYAVPGFPKNTLLITPFENLSIYIQKGSARRAIIDNPKRDRIENFESNNEDFVVEDYRAGCLIENIEMI